MGRSYSGDIEGEFEFAIQSSDDADFFGVEGYQPNYLQYNFDTDNLPDIEAGLEKCRQALKEYPDEESEQHREWQARYELGQEILACVKKSGFCSFQAEC